MNPAKSSVRPAEAGDLHQLACLRETLWPESTASEHAQELALILAGKPPTTMPLVIFVSEVSRGLLNGFLEVGLRSYADGCDGTHPVAYVEGWYVAESHRGHGAGAALLRAAEEWARAQGCREIASDTPVSNNLSQPTSPSASRSPNAPSSIARPSESHLSPSSVIARSLELRRRR
jgi:aminoglycoside 6'-N-acetyltransferase I